MGIWHIRTLVKYIFILYMFAMCIYLVMNIININNNTSTILNSSKNQNNMSNTSSSQQKMKQLDITSVQNKLNLQNEKNGNTCK